MPAEDARSWSQVEQERVRRLAVKAVKQDGMSRVAAARAYGVRRETISRWLRAERERGEQGLAAGRRGRRPGEQQALDARQQALIRRLITDKHPDQLKLPFALWTRQAVRELIERQCGVRLAVSTVGAYLRSWGFTPQRPLRRAFEQSSPAVARWLNEQYPALAARAKQEGALILWGDEMGLRSDQARGRSYAPKGKTPVIPSPGRRFSCNVIQAVSNRGQLAFSVFSGSLTQALFGDFLRRLLKHAHGRKLFLIVDGHPVHRGRQVAAWVDERPDQIELHLLPSYSPELNPAELLNNDTKQATLGHQRPRTQDELKASTRRHLHRRQKQPQVIQRFFTHPTVAYAA